MSRKTWTAKNFRLHPDNLRKTKAADVEKHLEGIDAKVSFDSVAGCFEIKCKVAQDWDEIIDRFLNTGIIGYVMIDDSDKKGGK